MPLISAAAVQAVGAGLTAGGVPGVRRGLRLLRALDATDEE